MILYNRKKVKYRKDGYCWKKRKDGKTTREDHMKLKVQGVEVKSRQGSLVPLMSFSGCTEEGMAPEGVRAGRLCRKCFVCFLSFFLLTPQSPFTFPGKPPD